MCGGEESSSKITLFVLMFNHLIYLEDQPWISYPGLEHKSDAWHGSETQTLASDRQVWMAAPFMSYIWKVDKLLNILILIFLICKMENINSSAFCEVSKIWNIVHI